MMKLFFLFAFMAMFPSPLRAAEARTSPCGVYELKGRLTSPQDTPGKVIFVVNEGTRAETRFEIPDESDFEKIASHLNQTVELSAVLKKPVSGMRGQIFELDRIRLRVPDPLLDHGLRQLKPMKCERE